MKFKLVSEYRTRRFRVSWDQRKNCKCYDSEKSLQLCTMGSVMMQRLGFRSFGLLGFKAPGN